MMQAAVAAAVPGEKAYELNTDNLAASTGRMTAGEGGSVSSPGGKTSFTFPEEALTGEDGSSFDVNLMEVTAALTHCFGTAAANTNSSNAEGGLAANVTRGNVTGVLGNIVTATITGSEVSGLTDPIVFELPNSGAGSDIPTCAWFDHSSKAWSTEGCSTLAVNAVASSGDRSNLNLTCPALSRT
jgi:hypothetical protein